MHKINHPYIAAALFAAFALPSQVSAQSTNVKTPNKNSSGKLKSFIVKGSGNLIESNSTASFIGGGQSNVVTANTTNAFIGGGFGNSVTNHFGTVSGGINNQVAGEGGTVGGGSHNDARGLHSVVGGGIYNAASGDYSTVPGGIDCRATHYGSFVWGADASGETESFGDQTFTVRCQGGARFYTKEAPFNNIGVSLTNGATSWASLSDSNAKTKVTAIDPRKILSKVASMPVTEWEYKAVPNRRYIGPMAQDFHAAFGLGDDDKSITTLDSDGVMYAAIKGLVEELKDRDKATAERDKEIGELKAKSAKVDQLEKLNRELTRRIESIDKRLDSLPPQP